LPVLDPVLALAGALEGEELPAPDPEVEPDPDPESDADLESEPDFESDPDVESDADLESDPESVDSDERLAPLPLPRLSVL
jgi:hypothetical protein